MRKYEENGKLFYPEQMPLVVNKIIMELGMSSDVFNLSVHLKKSLDLVSVPFRFDKVRRKNPLYAIDTPQACLTILLLYSAPSSFLWAPRWKLRGIEHQRPKLTLWQTTACI
jgi:hypothetical protein